MSPEKQPPEDVHPVLGVFPIGFLVGGLLALARVAFEHRAAAATQSDEEVLGFRLLAQAERWPDVLSEALIAGVVSAVVLAFGMSSRSLATKAMVLIVPAIAITAFMTGFPDGTPGFGVGTIAASIGLTLFAYGLARIPFAGKIPLVLGALVGIGLPLAAAHWVKTRQTGMPMRVVLIDLVAQPDLLNTVTYRAGAEPTPGIITPIVDQQSDTGDKPSLILPPNASQEFVVPAYGDGSRLVAAAGADLSVLKNFPQGIEVEYRVRIGGIVKWSTRRIHKPMAPGSWDTSSMQWQHVESGGERGLQVRAGQVVRFETELVGGIAAESLDASKLKLGFGGVMLIRTGRAPRAIPAPSAPNIVFIVMDTLRKDRVGCYGYDRETTPNIDALSRDGMRFDDAYTTSSWTWPSTASLMTGLSPDAHGVKSSESCTLSQRHRTLAEALQERGYTTAAFVGNPIVEPNRYFDQGFETFDVEVPVFRPSDKVVPQAIEWLRRHAPLRFFLYLHLVDPHTPHTPHLEEAARLGLGSAPADWPEGGLDRVPYDRPPSPETREYIDALYDASVATGDRWVGEVLAEIEALGLTESTIICFTTDHGEELFDHGSHGHGHAVWPELVQAPLILKGPGIPNEVRRGVVSNRFVPQTLAILAGAEFAPFGGSLNLVKDLLPDEALFETSKGVWGTARHQEIFGLRSSAFVTHWRATAIDAREVAESNMRRFDSLRDPGEQIDLINVSGIEGREAVGRIQNMVEEAREERPSLILGVGEGGQATLNDIGYGPDGRRVDKD